MKMDSFKKELRCGIVGLGVGKKKHIPGYLSHPQAKLVAIADTDPRKLQETGDQFNIPGRYNSLTEMLQHEKLDIVSIATPNVFHKEMTLEALAAGCHVMCEKPIGMNAQEAEEMIAASKQYGKRIMINYVKRNIPESVAMKQAVDQGLIGPIYYARSTWLRRRRLPGFGGWFGKKALSGGGPLIDIGVHRLDLALWLMGFPKPVWVMASTYDHIAKGIARKENKEFDVEDFAVALIKFENGATLELEASWCANIKDREHLTTRILGTKAGMLQRNIGDTYDSYAELYLEQDGCQYDMKLHSADGKVQDCIYDFIEAILHDKPNSCSPQEALFVMKILDAIYESARINQPVQIHFD